MCNRRHFVFVVGLLRTKSLQGYNVRNNAEVRTNDWDWLKMEASD